MQNIKKWILGILGALTLQSCISIPKGAVPVQPFVLDKYLGKWYEIARMDFRFERGLSKVSATYSLNEDGSVKVFNQGYKASEGKWKQATGRAKFVGNKNTASLKVSFFGPFYAGYHVIALDSEYKYALIAGNNPEYIWILARETSIPEEIRTSYLQKAASIGADTAKLIWTEQDNPSK